MESETCIINLCGALYTRSTSFLKSQSSNSPADLAGVLYILIARFIPCQTLLPDPNQNLKRRNKFTRSKRSCDFFFFFLPHLSIIQCTAELRNEWLESTSICISPVTFEKKLNKTYSKSTFRLQEVGAL